MWFNTWAALILYKRAYYAIDIIQILYKKHGFELELEGSLSSSSSRRLNMHHLSTHRVIARINVEFSWWDMAIWDGMWSMGYFLIFLETTKKAGPPVFVFGNASKDVGEQVLIARNAEPHVRSELVLLTSSFQKSLKERMVKEWHPYHKPLAIFTHIHHKVPFRNISRNQLITTVETWPPAAPTALVCPTVELPPLVEECPQEPPLLHHLYLWGVCVRGGSDQCDVMKWWYERESKRKMCGGYIEAWSIKWLTRLAARAELEWL